MHGGQAAVDEGKTQGLSISNIAAPGVCSQIVCSPEKEFCSYIRSFHFNFQARQRKMQQIARLLELPTNIVESMYQPPSSVQPAVSLRAMPGGVAVSGETILIFRSGHDFLRNHQK